MRLIVDISTALRWMDRHAVGIVRTEREIARHLTQNCTGVVLVYFDRESHDFRHLKQEQADQLFPDLLNHKSKKREDALEVNSFFAFRDNDVLVSAGLQWDIDFLSAVYNKKLSHRIKLVQVVYDIIPILMPEYCAPGMDVLFPKFIMDTAWTADAVYAISQSTELDFVNYVSSLKVGKCPPVRRIRLGCDIPSTNRPVIEINELQPREFVLYVSTIEPRKNHKMLFDIWRLLNSSQSRDLPTLVFVGGAGWNVENFINILHNCFSLYPRKIRILNDVSDDQLQWLYSNAYFTVYPSLYEGWGLPIAESLARGTPCIASNSSSMPEVARSLCDLVDPYDFMSWKLLIEKYIANPILVENKRMQIQSEYKIDTWSEAISAFEADLNALINDWSLEI